jgi:hypothetical protein
VKFKNLQTRIYFDRNDIRQALADYVDFYHNKPELAKKILANECSRAPSANGMFVLDVKSKPE